MKDTNDKKRFLLSVNNFIYVACFGEILSKLTLTFCLFISPFLTVPESTNELDRRNS